MSAEKPFDTLVLDAGPLLKNEPTIDTLLAKATQLNTIPSVVNEIRDRNARQRIETQLLPFLKLQSPRPASFDFVSSFAKKTGDFSVLSRTDLEILALTYELEVERNGNEHLRKAPQNRALTKAPEKSTKATAKVQQHGDDVIADTELAKPNASVEKATEDDVQTAEGSEIVESIQVLKIQDATPTETVESPREEPIDETDAMKSSALLEADDGSDTDASEGWITPSNIKKHQEKASNTSSTTTSQPQTPQIACITTDFAMQNVLLQIGLNLLSPSLNRIRVLKTFILRCHACFFQVHDTSKQFCPRCGKPTLTRVSCSTDSKGVFRVHLKKNMEWHHKGDRYSIPKPVHGSASGKQRNVRGGGRGGWAQELILAEDQKEYMRAVSGVGGREKKAKDLMDEDYLPSILTGRREKPGGKVKVGAGKMVNSKKRRE